MKIQKTKTTTKKSTPCEIVINEGVSVSHCEVDNKTQSKALSIDLTPGNNMTAWNLLTQSDTHLMITASAGNGKTSLIKEYARLHPNTVMLAPTGTAARLIGGQTIHSFFGINPQNLHEQIRPEMFKKMQKVISVVDTIITDESGMIRSDLMDCIDRRCQMLTGKPIPFGGIRMIFSFDLWQLPPVLKTHEYDTKEETSEYKVFKQLYDTKYFYGSNVMERLIVNKDIKLIELNHCFRQSEDLEFAKVLNKIRTGDHGQEDLDWLNARCAYKEDKLTSPTIICLTKKKAAQLNEARLAMLESKSHTFVGVRTGKKTDDPVPVENTFKVGANVMIKVNDKKKDKDGNSRYQNGTIATVTAITKEAIEVRIKGQIRPIVLEKNVWIDYAYTLDRFTQTVEAQEVGSYENIPAVVAYCLNSHVMQGQTLEEAIIDPQFGEWPGAEGLIYVALSRVTSVQGLAFTRKLKMGDFVKNTELGKFFDEIKDITVK